jgi:DNA-binding SARP family transcriptional activator
VLDFFLCGHGAAAALSTGRREQAKAFLLQMAPCVTSNRAWEICFYYVLSTWDALLENDMPAASAHAEQAMKFADAAGMVQKIAATRLGMAHVLHAGRAFVEADRYLDEALTICAQNGFRQTAFACRLAKAEFALDRGDRRQAIVALQEALPVARERGYVNAYYWRPAVMTGLCMLALEAEIETRFVQDLIRRRNLVPAQAPVQLENWPWPLRIYTLGRFSAVKDQQPIRTSGKQQRKPLELLKALIAFGGRNVSETVLAEALWPDAEGDAAHQVLATTLKRLRNLLGYREAVRLQGRKLTLDARYVWVDSWPLEQLLNKASQALREHRPDDAWPLCEKALSLYSGAFLQGEAEYPWAVTAANRLRGKLVKLLGQVGRQWEYDENWAGAVACYEKGLEVDSLSEELYQRLMICHQKNGHTAEAISTYGRCRDTLSALLHIEPSPRTQQLFRALNPR